MSSQPLSCGRQAISVAVEMIQLTPPYPTPPHPTLPLLLTVSVIIVLDPPSSGLKFNWFQPRLWHSSSVERFPGPVRIMSFSLQPPTLYLPPVHVTLSIPDLARNSGPDTSSWLGQMETERVHFVTTVHTWVVTLLCTNCTGYEWWNRHGSVNSAGFEFRVKGAIYLQRLRKIRKMIGP
jgi:hypothetical protein